MPKDSSRRFSVQTPTDDLLRVREVAARFGAAFPPDLSTLEIMTVLLEDRRYFSHRGVDWLSVLREISKLIRFRRPGGASTIEMQFVRTVTGYRGRTLWRKIYETLLAIALQRQCEKRCVLRAYLAVAYFGTKLTGADVATHQLYDKPVDQLTLEEAAFIGAMLCYPRPRGAPPKWKEKVGRRAAYGLVLYRTTWPAVAPDHGALVERRNPDAARCDSGASYAD